MRVPRVVRQWRRVLDHDCLLTHDEAPAEAEYGPYLVRLADEGKEAVGGPIEIVPAGARWRIEQRWREAEPAKGMRKGAERFIWVHLELHAFARAVR